MNHKINTMRELRAVFDEIRRRTEWMHLMSPSIPAPESVAHHLAVEALWERAYRLSERLEAERQRERLLHS